VSDLVAPYLDSFVDFVKKEEPDIVYNEVAVFNRKCGYAGTCDLIMRLNGHTYLVDVKTGASGVWPEHALQVCAYSRADFLVLDGKEVAMPPIDRGAILLLSPTGYTFMPVVIDDEVFTSFRHIIETYRWQKHVAPRVIGHH
jgi:hypothetical protein